MFKQRDVVRQSVGALVVREDATGDHQPEPGHRRRSAGESR
ncbi:hypothetical protein ACIPW5_04960 [Streptomyces sp. NPDC090077]